MFTNQLFKRAVTVVLTLCVAAGQFGLTGSITAEAAYEGTITPFNVWTSPYGFQKEHIAARDSSTSVTADKVYFLGDTAPSTNSAFRLMSAECRLMGNYAVLEISNKNTNYSTAASVTPVDADAVAVTYFDNYGNGYCYSDMDKSVTSNYFEKPTSNDNYNEKRDAIPDEYKVLPTTFDKRGKYYYTCFYRSSANGVFEERYRDVKGDVHEFNVILNAANKASGVVNVVFDIKPKKTIGYRNIKVSYVGKKKIGRKTSLKDFTITADRYYLDGGNEVEDKPVEENVVIDEDDFIFDGDTTPTLVEGENVIPVRFKYDDDWGNVDRNEREGVSDTVDLKVEVEPEVETRMLRSIKAKFEKENIYTGEKLKKTDISVVGKFDVTYDNGTSEQDVSIDISNEDFVIEDKAAVRGVNTYTVTFAEEGITCTDEVSVNAIDEFDLSETGELTKYQGKETGNVVLPEGIRSIGERAFDKNSGVTSVQLVSDELLTSIDERAFGMPAADGIQIRVLPSQLEAYKAMMPGYAATNQIVAATIQMKDCEISLSDSDSLIEFEGKKYKKPIVAAVTYGYKSAKVNVDYTYEYSFEDGMIVITLSGSGDFSGTTKKSIDAEEYQKPADSDIREQAGGDTSSTGGSDSRSENSGGTGSSGNSGSAGTDTGSGQIGSGGSSGNSGSQGQSGNGSGSAGSGTDSGASGSGDSSSNSGGDNRSGSDTSNGTGDTGSQTSNEKDNQDQNNTDKEQTDEKSEEEKKDEETKEDEKKEEEKKEEKSNEGAGEAPKTSTGNDKKDSQAPKKTTVKPAKSSLKRSALKKKKNRKVKISVKSDGKITFSNVTKKKLKKYVKISKKGVVTFKKNAKKGTYKFRVKVKGTKKYKAVNKVVKIKVK